MPAAVQGPANEFAVELFRKVRVGDTKQLNVKALRKVLRRVQMASRREFRQARRLMRRGLDTATIEEYNRAADRRFEVFKKSLKL